MRKNRIHHATTGSVWIHHFGSVTQKNMKMGLGKKSNDVLVKVNDRKLYGQTWVGRKVLRYNLKKSHQQWRKQELNTYGMTLHGARKQEHFIWL